AIKATHPDIHSGDPNASVRLRQIVGAYSILRDADKRAAYNRRLQRIRQRQAATCAAGPVPQGAVRAAGKAGRRSNRAKPVHAIFGVKGPTVAMAIDGGRTFGIANKKIDWRTFIEAVDTPFGTVATILLALALGVGFNIFLSRSDSPSA